MRSLSIGMLAAVMATAVGGAALAQDSVGAPPEQTHFKVSSYKPMSHDAATAKALERFNDDRYSMFIHWGIYAQAGGVIRGKRYYGASEWLMSNSKTPSAEYLELAKDFNPVDFDARAWMKTMKAAGFRYMVITAKHHDGFAMFKSAASPHNIVDGTRFGRDPLKELAEAAKAEGIGLGFYYSQYQDWTEPNGGGNTWEFDPKKADFEEYFNRKVVPQVTELLTNYGPVREIWFDTPGPMPAEYSRRLRDLVKKLQPGCLLNSRIGNDLGDYTSPSDSEIPPASLVQGGDWESVFTHNRSWGYSAFDNDFKSTNTLIRLLATSASRGGNFMLNMGPDGRGRFPDGAQKRLLAVGAWLKVNGDSIYGTTRSPLPQTPWGVATQKGSRLYLHVLDRPADGVVRAPGLTEPVTKVSLLAGGGALRFKQDAGGLSVTLPAGTAPSDDLVVVVETQTPVAARRDQGIVLSRAYGRQPLDVADATLSPGVKLDAIKTQLSVDDLRKFYTPVGLDDPSKSVSWTVQVEQAGDYHIDLEYSATKAQAGHEGTVEVGDQKRSFGVIETGAIERRKPTFLTFQPVGILHFDKPGRYQVSLRPQASGQELFALRTLYLTPAN
ncbi:MAG: alpha-L-fucosidase [Caulobacter sp.]|nr:alpha-L-fucosidase [Caulobacter sp.]